jgi:uncharacterized protein YprB with RNaseH-like and TPR domain
MASNLKSRLQRIRNMPQAESAKTICLQTENVSENLSAFDKVKLSDAQFGDEWQQAGFKVLKRSIISTIDYDLPPILPGELKVLVPDFIKVNQKSVKPEDMIFFDLETTGLSGGAGTVAFLAAIGFFIPSNKTQNRKQSFALQIDQYLLLDYPGEADFLESIIPNLNAEGKIIITYNGKSFDTKLFRTRCLMNGTKPPIYEEADLLHPARRLWKRILPNCSQAEIETSILGLDRTGDVSGAFAPQIWFDFLKSQAPHDLLNICDHNKKDIEGLASLFVLFTKIAAHPLETLNQYQFDIEAAALRWRDVSRYFSAHQLFAKQAETLMAFCVEKKLPKAMYLYGCDLLKKGFHDKGVSLFIKLLETNNPETELVPSLKISVLHSLAIDAEWRLKDTIKALNYVDALLQIENLTESLRKKAEQRRERLLTKIPF